MAVSRSGARIARFRALRPWIALDRRLRRRSTTLVIALARPGPIRFILRQLAPRCRLLGTFTTPGHQGVNRIRFRARGGKLLTPGTYSLTVRPLGAPARSPARRIRLVVVDARAPGAALVAMLSANSCDGTPAPPQILPERLPDVFKTALATPSAGRATTALDRSTAAPKPNAAAATARSAAPLEPRGSVLGETFSRIEDDDWPLRRLAFFAALALVLAGGPALTAAVRRGRARWLVRR